MSIHAYTCDFSVNVGQGYVYAGHYSGTTVVPSSVSVTAAGIEAQCLLRTMGFEPGTIDGIFGRNSKAAMRDFQQTVNSRANAGLTVDGLPGPQSWPWIRSWAYKGP
ncbi:peptidoglycan-binding protein [Streptomyces sp. NPDC006285]|uniref:peptidoglycan-binding domain-containing protein n=1 Tax=Streptomyces sp. NPDC006285 TaxID=3364742 RepID=UPI00367F3529